MRAGIGYDIHRLVKDRKLFLGGVEIPHSKGLLAHSDGDVVIHAICDAILGAIGMGDIGEHFPDKDSRYKNIDSCELLKMTVKKVCEKKFTINNIDVVVIAEEPKIFPFKSRMVEKISGITGMDKDRVNIKATTNEGVGSIGNGDAIASYAIVTLEEKR